MNKICLFLVVFSFIPASCGYSPSTNLSPNNPTETAVPASTFKPAPTATTIPTAPATSPAISGEVNPTTDPSTWSANVQAQFKTVFTTPDKATQADWDAYDTYLTAQMHTALQTAGIANAETLQNYDLIRAMVEYAKNHGYEFDLTPSMARLIITDTGNLISTVNNNGYGVGGAAAPPFTHDELLVWAKADWSHVTIFGKTFKLSDSPDKPFAMNIVSTEGDAVALLNIPGINPDSAQGVLIAMKKPDGTMGYGIVMAVYSADNSPKTKSSDLCSVKGVIAVDCASGESLPSTIIVNNASLGNHIELTKAQLDVMMKTQPFHVNVVYHTAVKIWWIDGMAVPYEFRVSAVIPPAQ